MDSVSFLCSTEVENVIWEWEWNSFDVQSMLSLNQGKLNQKKWKNNPELTKKARFPTGWRRKSGPKSQEIEFQGIRLDLAEEGLGQGWLTWKMPGIPDG